MIDELAAAVPDGATVALAQDAVGVSMAATRALVRRGARNLHLVCVPISGLQADVLIGAGCVRTIETSAVTLGEFGTAPRFAAALKAGSIRDARCDLPRDPCGIAGRAEGTSRSCRCAA